MSEELIERLKITEQMLNVAHFKEAESLIREARDAIEELQSQQSERKKGKWIVEGHHPDYLLRCSARQEIAMWAGGISYIYPNFCPNCGARMEGEEK